jgi:xanthine dehydrogenase accessory factor
MSAKKLQRAFAQWAAEGRPLVLATVFETAGSTYSKSGAQMLITADGKFQGMLSGGCLEGDLALRAAAVIASASPQTVSYDLGQNDEELWGLGVGCDGLMRIFLQPLVAENGYEPFASMSKAFAGENDQVAITVLESSLEDLPAGSTLITVAGDLGWTDIGEVWQPQIRTLESRVGGQGESICESSCESMAIDGNETRVLVSILRPPPSVLVLGGGLDAEPVVRFADELGWRVTISDHRPAYIESGDFATAEHICCLPVADVATELDLNIFSAVIVMSHHLASDRRYLQQIAATSIPYVGLLGPPDRRQRLLDDLGDAADRLAGRIRGPAGIDIGARGPAPIALSIIAEMHQFLMHKST